MSEYPIHCKDCGEYQGYTHASDWSDNMLCPICWKEKYGEQTELNEYTNKK